MAFSPKDLLIRASLLLVISLGLLWIMSPALKTTQTRLRATVDLHAEGVSLQSSGGFTTVRVDEKEETMPSSEADRSTLYRELAAVWRRRSGGHFSRP